MFYSTSKSPAAHDVHGRPENSLVAPIVLVELAIAELASCDTEVLDSVPELCDLYGDGSAF